MSQQAPPPRYRDATYGDESVVLENGSLRLVMHKRMNGWGYGELTFRVQEDRLLFRAGETLTLWQDFANNSNVAAAARKGPTFTFTRTSTATFFDSSGVLQTAASGAPRFDHNPADSNAAIGLLIEGARTNLCLQSKDWTTTWTNINSDEPTTNNASPSGNDDAVEIAATSTADQQVALHQSFTGRTAGALTTVSASMRPGTNATFVQLAWDSDGGGSDGVFCNFNLSTGAAGTVTAMTAGTATLATIQDIGGSYFRCAVTGAIITGTAGRFTINIVDRIDAVKFEAADLTDNDSLIGTDAGVEIGEYVSSVIPTTTGSVLRAHDNLTTLDVDWLNLAAGAWFVKVRTGPGGANNVIAQFIFVVSDNTFNAYQQLLLEQTAGNDPRVQLNTVGEDGSVQSSVNITRDTVHRFALAYEIDDLTFFHDGTLVGQDVDLDTLPAGLDRMHIGSHQGSGAQFFGHISEIKYWNVRKPDLFLDAETTP